MNNEGCNGGVLVINDLSIHPKTKDGFASVIPQYPEDCSHAIEYIDGFQAKLIVDNLSSQFDLEYAGVKDIYKITEKWKDTAYSSRDFEHGYATAMKDVKEYIEQRYPQVTK